MKPIRFVFSHDSIFQDVKLETSHLAVRKRDKSGGSVDAEGTGYFDLLVFDEDSLVKFRELFRDARADILSAVSAYTHPVPFVPEYREDDDFGRQRDFALTLAMPDGFNPHLSEALNARIREDRGSIDARPRRGGQRKRKPRRLAAQAPKKRQLL
jgi:hypothetical protein